MSDVPEELRVSADRRTLSVTFRGETTALAAELLRVESPSAEVQGHDPSQKVLVFGKQDVRIERLVPTGHYAVRIVFDDGHDTGLYTWQRLAEFARDHTTMMQDYHEATRR